MQVIRLGAIGAKRQLYGNKTTTPGVTTTVLGQRLSTLFVGLILCASTLLMAGSVRADDDSLDGDEGNVPNHVQLDKDFILPKGEIIQGDGRRVLLKNTADELAVGRIYVEGDNRYLVTMPNGSLMSVTKDEVSLTDRPFQPQTAEEMEEALLASTFEGFKSKRTKRYLYFYSCTDTYFKAANMILETMHPKILNYCEKLDLDVQEREFPLVVVMFGDRESFDEYKPRPRGVAAYYSLISNYIIMYEDPELTEYAPQYALKSSVSTIAHEGVHQILGNVGVQKRFARWPIWIQEGLPEYCSPTDTGKRVRWRGLGLMNNIQMHSLIEYRDFHKATRKKGPWLNVKEMSTAKGLTALGYAHAWGMTYGLAKNRQTKDEFAAFLGDVSKLGPLEEPPEPGYFFNKHFGKKHRETSEHAVKELSKASKRKYVDPIENQTYFVGVIETRRAFYTRISPSIASLRRWATSASDDGVRGTFRVEAFPSYQKAQQAKRDFLRKKL